MVKVYKKHLGQKDVDKEIKAKRIYIKSVEKCSYLHNTENRQHPS